MPPTAAATCSAAASPTGFFLRLAGEGGKGRHARIRRALEAHTSRSKSEQGAPPASPRVLLKLAAAVPRNPSVRFMACVLPLILLLARAVAAPLYSLPHRRCSLDRRPLFFSELPWGEAGEVPPFTPGSSAERGAAGRGGWSGGQLEPPRIRWGPERGRAAARWPCKHARLSAFARARARRRTLRRARLPGGGCSLLGLLALCPRPVEGQVQPHGLARVGNELCGTEWKEAGHGAAEQAAGPALPELGGDGGPEAVRAGHYCCPLVAQTTCASARAT